MNPAQLAAAIHGLHRERPDLLEALHSYARTVAPGHLVDQAQAASADAERVILTHPLGTAGQVPVDTIPDWLLLGVITAYAEWVTGNATTCPHQPTAERPQVVAAAAGRPGRVVCASCTHLLRLSGAADRTCDRCGTVCRGLPDDGIFPGMLHYGPMVFGYGLCGQCHREAFESREPRS